MGPVAVGWIGILVIAGLLTCFVALKGWSSECLIEGRSLSFRRAGDDGWGSIPLDEVEQILSVYFWEQVHSEVLFKSGERSGPWFLAVTHRSPALTRWPLPHR